MIDLDNNKRFQLQNAERRYSECVGISTSDVGGNWREMLFDSDFSEAAAFHIQGKRGSEDGVDLLSAMYAACVYGFLPENLDTSDPIQTSEAIESDWASYTPTQIATAAKFAPAGVRSLKSYDDVIEHLLREKMGCVLQLRWNTAWTGFGGQVPMPAADARYTDHAVACYGYSALGLAVKAWDIPEYHYLPRSVFQKVFVVGYAFDMNAYKWLTIVSAILYTRNWSLLPLLNTGATMKRV